MAAQCRSRHFDPDFTCERTQGHDGWHRAELTPVSIATDSDAQASVVSWL